MLRVASRKFLKSILLSFSFMFFGTTFLIAESHDKAFVAFSDMVVFQKASIRNMLEKLPEEIKADDLVVDTLFLKKSVVKREERVAEALNYVSDLYEVSSEGREVVDALCDLYLLNMKYYLDKWANVSDETIKNETVLSQIKECKKTIDDGLNRFASREMCRLQLTQFLFHSLAGARTNKNKDEDVADNFKSSVNFRGAYESQVELDEFTSALDSFLISGKVFSNPPRLSPEARQSLRKGGVFLLKLAAVVGGSLLVFTGIYHLVKGSIVKEGVGALVDEENRAGTVATAQGIFARAKGDPTFAKELVEAVVSLEGKEREKAIGIIKAVLAREEGGLSFADDLTLAIRDVPRASEMLRSVAIDIGLGLLETEKGKEAAASGVAAAMRDAPGALWDGVKSVTGTVVHAPRRVIKAVGNRFRRGKDGDEATEVDQPNT